MNFYTMGIFNDRRDTRYRRVNLGKKRMTAAQRRQSIIEATINVVARLNYDRATTALIAKEAGVNEALIYYHFKSKKELQLATLDYLVESQIALYRKNPVFQKKNKHKSVIKIMNQKFLDDIRKKNVSIFTCFIKAFLAIDDHIKEKAWECIQSLNEFNRLNMEEDINRGFFDENYDPDIIVWGMLGATMLSSSLAMNGKLDKKTFNSIKKLHTYYEDLVIRDKDSKPST